MIVTKFVIMLRLGGIVLGDVGAKKCLIRLLMKAMLSMCGPKVSIKTQRFWTDFVQIYIKPWTLEQEQA